METLILNPYYILHHDRKRSYICSKESLINSNKPQNLDCSKDWQTKIHPAYAMILSFFTHRDPLNVVLEKLEYFLEKDKDEIYKLIRPLIKNPEPAFAIFQGRKFHFPKNILINSREESNGKEYWPEDFKYSELDYSSKRLFSVPMSITLMLNNKCATTCEYCYADIRNRTHCQIPFDRICSLLKDAYDHDIYDFSLLGGEVFLYKEWYALLKEMKKYGYYPDLISTKVPLNKTEVDKLKNVITDATDIQLSLDSTDISQLEMLLKVKNDYLEKITLMLHLMENAKINVSIATTLIKRNSNIENIENIAKYLSQFSNIKSWNIGPAFDSLYIQSFHKIKADYKTLNNIRTYIESIKDKYNFEIDFDNSFLDKEYYGSKGSKEFKGASCSANRHHMLILPDGNVTICEQLYWNPLFIVGNIQESSIEAVWNSERSLFFANLEQHDIKKESICSSCGMFKECYLNMNRCWVEVLKAYGDENWDFPDPRCIYAPKMINDLRF